MNKEKFIVGDYDDDHIIGDKECDACWSGFPQKCVECGKGLTHATFGDENYDCDYWLYYKCDVCGATSI